MAPASRPATLPGMTPNSRPRPFVAACVLALSLASFLACTSTRTSQSPRTVTLRTADFAQAFFVEQGIADFAEGDPELETLARQLVEAATAMQQKQDPTAAASKAFELCNRALVSGPSAKKRSKVLGVRAELHGMLGQWDVAHGRSPLARLKSRVSDLDAAIDASPAPDARLFLSRATSRAQLVQVNRGNPSAVIPGLRRSLADAQRVLELEPDWGYAYQMRASIRLYLGSLALEFEGEPFAHGEKPDVVLNQALSDCDEALRLTPALVEVHGIRGTVLQGLGRYAEAIEAYEALLAARPEDPAAAASLAKARKAKDEAPSVAKTYLRRAGESFAAGDYDWSALFCTRALRLDPKNDGARAMRGASRVELGEFEPALADLTQALAALPDDPNILTARGRAHAGLNKPVEARADFDRAIERQPAQLEAWKQRGLLRLKAREFEGALSDFNQLVKLAPNLPTGPYNLACSYSIRSTSHPRSTSGDAARKEDVDRAFAALDQAIALGWNKFDQLERDPDLAALRADPRFQRILDAGPKAP